MKIKEIEEKLFSQKEIATDFLDEIRLDSRMGVQKLVKKYDSMKEKEEQVKKNFFDMLCYENELRAKGIRYIAGIDEVGRGPLAGPVVSAAVILPEQFYLPGLTDSKKLSKEKRDHFYEIIIKEAIAYHVVFIPANIIDEINIYEATKKAMDEAIMGLKTTPEHLLIDAMKLDIRIPQTSIIKGDSHSISIAASSVLAKVERDRYMEELSETYPQYGFSRHMGYGTKEHLDAIQKHGVMIEHRRSFSPVREAIQSN